MSFTSRLTMMTAAAALLASAAVADTRLRIAGTVPAEHFGNAVLEQMAKDIEDAGVGLDVKYFPAGQLGSGEELLESAIRGEVQMVHATVYAQKDPRLEINSLPFMVTTKAELDAVYGDPDSEYNKILEEILTSFGIQPLGTIGEGLIGMIATQRPADPTNIGSQGMNVRAWSSQIAKQTMEELGYNVTTLNWAEVFPAVQAGTIDGAICCTPEWAYTTFAASGVGNTYVPYNAFIESTMIYANKRFYDGLTDEQREVVARESAEAAAEISKLAWERSQGFVEQLKAADWEIVEFSQEERDAIKAHIQATVWPNVADVVGQDILDRLTAN
ncbi:TRAP transporter substrate-binding protein DctP [Roseovarius rhodophyticola]|uniref:TRAP transporter substrate-binding protein DctP n=1 Tax=Roseovarius rhodophyticola TaxID=3080827 RepID=A0ABZ2TQM6_9RHOB|nr:TRAP transporter substrate-binding protein DctP [Roseovarius sp. W115]MDV2927949.1 TRAP transporter substrate-binding protein DctP [Roseovarius sp. W115]